jgi:hypothetical protein
MTLHAKSFCAPKGGTWRRWLLPGRRKPERKRVVAGGPRDQVRWSLVRETEGDVSFQDAGKLAGSLRARLTNKRCRLPSAVCRLPSSRVPVVSCSSANMRRHQPIFGSCREPRSFVETRSAEAASASGAAAWQPRRCSEREQAAAGGEDDGFSAGGGAELVEDGVDVELGGVAADAKAGGDVAVGQTFGQ